MSKTPIMSGDLGPAREQLRRARAIVERAEEAAGALPVPAYQQALLRNALEAAGIEFTNGDEPGVKLKAKGERAR